MGFRTLSISIFVIMFMSMSEVMYMLISDIPDGGQKFMAASSHTNIGNLTGVSPDQAGLNNMSIQNSPQDELSQAGLGFKNYNLLQVIWSVLVNSTWGFGDYIMNFFEIPASATSIAFFTIVSWMIMFNHAMALYQIVFRPLGGEA